MQTRIQSLVILAFLAACESVQLEAPVDCTTANITLMTISTKDNTGCGTADGSFEVEAMGGEPPFQYTVNSQSNAMGVFENLEGGNYTVLVTDSNGCTASQTLNIENSEGLNISLTTTTAGCGSEEGVISVDATGGLAPYQYKLGDDPIAGVNEFRDLPVGTYELIVTDANNCEVTQVLDIESGVSFSNSVSPIIENQCAISGCHAGSQFPDLRTFSNIQASANQIRSRTTSGTMPPSGPLSQNQIDLIACWVDDGAPGN